jgi:transcriptional regulator with XRE-family HTH domain
MTVETDYCRDVTTVDRPETATPIQRMGGRIRELRQRDKLTLVELAARTGLSHSFLSQVERGHAQPSMSSLYRIAEALGTTQDRLIATEDESVPSVAVLRADEGVTIPVTNHGSATGGQARQLLVEPGVCYPTEFLVRNREFGEFYRHEGTEFLYVAEGAIEVELDSDGGERCFRLAARDSLRYLGDLPHRWRSAARTGACVLMVHTNVRSNPTLS